MITQDQAIKLAKDEKFDLEAWLDEKMYHRDSVPGGYVFQEVAARQLAAIYEARIATLERELAESKAENERLRAMVPVSELPRH